MEAEQECEPASEEVFVCNKSFISPLHEAPKGYEAAPPPPSNGGLLLQIFPIPAPVRHPSRNRRIQPS